MELRTINPLKPTSPTTEPTKKDCIVSDIPNDLPDKPNLSDKKGGMSEVAEEEVESEEKKQIVQIGKEIINKALNLPTLLKKASADSSEHPLEHLGRLKLLPKKKIKKAALRNNPFGAFSDSEDSNSDEETSDSGSSSISEENIRRFVKPEDLEGWSTVACKEKSATHPVREFKRDKYPWELEQQAVAEGSLEELALEEHDVIHSRQFGKQKKSHHFKAIQQRSYAMEKRDAQKRNGR